MLALGFGQKPIRRGKNRGVAERGAKISFGDYALQAVERGWVTARQIEAARIAANHVVRGEGRIHIRIFPHKSITGRPPETRMGKGKGEPDFWAAVVRPGTVLYEIAGVSEEAARLCFNRLAHKMPLKVRFLKRRIM